MKPLEQILQTYWGYSSFRPLQKDIISTLLDRRDVVALLPTGGGKSLCYQLPAVAIDGCCLVVSPLVSLMQDQVKHLDKLGINATALHAGIHPKEVENRLIQAARGVYKLLYISPERLQSYLFRDFLPDIQVSFVAVDEAHCISQWGYDFRPDYLKINTIRNIFREIPVLALTATATPEVEEDIIRQLRLYNPAIFRQSFKRDNIFYQVSYSDNKINDTVAILKARQESSIVYCRSRRQTELLSKSLRNFGILSECYHAGLSREKRDEVQTCWMNDQINTIVATTAFGMGIDKPNVRTVVHFDVPEYPEAYYQEAGRAGRDGQPALATIFYHQSDIVKLEESAAIRFPPESYLRQVYQAVCEYLQIPTGASPDKYYSFNLAEFCKRFGQQALPASYALKLLEQEGLWTLTEAVFTPTTVYITTDREAIDLLRNSYPDIAIILTTLLRLYGTLFNYPTPVKISVLAKHLKIRQEELRQYFIRLDQSGILEYREPTDSAQLHFHHLRSDSQHLIIDTSRINRLKEKHIFRTQAMTGYLQLETSCRERYILRYFGENTAQDCRHCDHCFTKYTKPDLKTVQARLLATLSEPQTLEQLLRQFQLNEKEKALEILRQMIDEGKVLKDVKGGYRLV